jgi:hypothetical protein
MAQLRTPSEFSEAITSDLTWRIREISDIRTVAERSDAGLRGAILRAGITLIYAHWEGHVMFVSKCYLDFLAARRLRFDNLKRAFFLGRFYRQLRQGSFGSTHSDRLGFLNAVLDSGGDRFSQPNYDLVASGSNLKSSILADICCALSIDADVFAGDADFIDKILVHRRNGIAHGESLTIDLPGFIDMSNRVIELMRRFNNLVDNDATLGAYLAVSRSDQSRRPVGT